MIILSKCYIVHLNKYHFYINNRSLFVIVPKEDYQEKNDISKYRKFTNMS